MGSFRQRLVWLAVLITGVLAPRAIAAREGDVHTEVTLETGTGIVHGRGVRSFDATSATVAATVETKREWERLELVLPLSLSHEQPLGTPLAEARAASAPELTWEVVPKLKLTLGGSLGGVWRPQWPDLYQPQPGGGLARTHRYSYLERTGNLELVGRPAKHQHARLKYEYALVTYEQDPRFDAVARPNHLTPGNYEQHRLTPSWRIRAAGVSVNLKTEVAHRRYLFTFARDAGTGATHAGPGGPAPNPLLRVVTVTPSVSAALDLSNTFVLRPGYGIALATDTYAGYYSSTEHQPELDFAWQAARGLSVEGDLGLWSRRYGPGSYAAGPDHPPLDFGQRRVTRRFSASLAASIAVRGPWGLRLEARGARRETNFPDYVPGVFPATAEYDIDRDYLNLAGFCLLTFQAGG